MELVMTRNFYELNELESLMIDGGFNLKDLGGAMAEGAVTGGLGGAVAGGSASLGTLTVPGWVAGAVTGGLIGGAGYCVGELWDAIFG